MFKQILTAIVVASSISAWATPEQPDRNVAEYNLTKDGIGLKGYDPVAYFINGGEVLKGTDAISLEYGDVIYKFSSEANALVFGASPAKFEPTYGGWCAWAMTKNQRVKINTSLYTISGNRAHFFVNRGAKARFDRDIAGNEAKADAHWLNQTGEAPRK